MSYNEGRMIVESHRELGDQWTIIAKRLPGHFRASGLASNREREESKRARCMDIVTIN